MSKTYVVCNIKLHKAKSSQCSQVICFSLVIINVCCNLCLISLNKMHYVQMSFFLVGGYEMLVCL